MFARFFIDRPVFATVVSLVIVVIGAVAFISLPVAQYPEIAPPTISVSAAYPGASARIVAETVATPLEVEINGVERMLYMSSSAGNDGTLNLVITFELGTDLDQAQVLVQNRVALATPRLPEEVRRQGITINKQSPNFLLVVNMISPDQSRDQLFLSNYATLNIKDELARVDGAGNVVIFGAREYSMRIWLDPEKLAARQLTPADVTAALREQNLQVAAGRIGQPPITTGQNFQYAVNARGRLVDPEEFGQVIVKTGTAGQVTHLREVARIERGARNYDMDSYLDGSPSVGVAVFQRPGSNALAAATALRSRMKELKTRFPAGVDYGIVYDTTMFIDESIDSVYRTVIEAFLLVALVVLVFLQDWKGTILPMIDVPVSLIGTFAVMAALGFTINNLTLFGMVLAIGIVVDDAIVVLENIERWIARGLAPREATIRAMAEITGPVIAITLVLSSVFIPTAFIPGLSGQFYRQFALTIAGSTIISAINALTMTPSRAVQIMGREHGAREPLPRWGYALVFGGLAVWLLAARFDARAWNITILGQDVNFLRAFLFIVGAGVGVVLAGLLNRVLAAFFHGFNFGFDKFTQFYAGTVRRLVRFSPVMLGVYVALMAATYWAFMHVPRGFIPQQDKGYLVCVAQLPDGASLDRTTEVMNRVEKIASKIPGVTHTINIPGFSFLNGLNLSNAAAMFLTLEPFEIRKDDPSRSAQAILGQLQAQLGTIKDGIVMAFNAPPVEGVGNTGGFKVMLLDVGNRGLESLQGAADNLGRSAMGQPGLAGVFSTFRVGQPQLFLEVDRTKAKTARVALSDVFDALQSYLGGGYANDFTFEGRNWQVTVQADAAFRDKVEDIGRLKVRNADGKMVPLASVLEVKEVTGPAVVNRYQLYYAADINGQTLPGTTSLQGLNLIRQIAAKELDPRSFQVKATELTLQEEQSSKNIWAILAFPLGVLFVYMVLAAQYESWSLPTAIILIVPMCLSAAIAGVWLMGMDNNIFVQIGNVVLIGLASKNAILIVEFAKQQEDAGKNRIDAIVEACRLRLRPILMTSFAFILGVLPLAHATGAGSEMRRSLGIAVFSGMLGVTAFGLFFTPVFYYSVRWLVERMSSRKVEKPHARHAGPPQLPTLFDKETVQTASSFHEK
ncbi:MAG: efflux RND transporter permease subunit [Gemmataceae bacterium]